MKQEEIKEYLVQLMENNPLEFVNICLAPVAVHMSRNETKTLRLHTKDYLNDKFVEILVTLEK